MLADSHNNTILLSLHDAPEGAHPLADLDNLILDEDLLALRDRAQVGDIKGAADAEILPEAGLVGEQDGHGGGEVEESCRAATVQVVQPVAVLRPDGKGEGDTGLGVGDGVEAYVRKEGAHVVLWGLMLELMGCLRVSGRKWK